MCLISALPKGTVKYNETVKSFITRGFTSQQDGSGVMWKRDGESVVNLKKGFFNLPALLTFVEELQLTEQDELVIHHRTSTQGLVSKSNTHPFVLTSDHEICTSLEGSFDLPVLVHNGMFRHMTKFDHRDFSDTYSFCNGFLSNKHLLAYFKEDTVKFLESFDPIIGWSKLCVLFPDMDMVMTGDFTEDGGYFHSNQCYKDYGYTDRGGRTYGTGRYPSHDISYPNTRDSKKKKTGNSTNTGKGTSRSATDINPSLLNKVLSTFSWGNGPRNMIANTKIDDKLVTLNSVNNTDFVYLLKPGVTLGSIDNTKAYKINGYNETTGDCNLYVPSMPNYWIHTKLTNLKTLFFYIPTTEKAYMYNDFLYLEEKLIPSKTQLKKVEKQINSRYNREDSERFIIKKLGELVSRGGAKLWLQRHHDNPFKAVIFDHSGNLIDKEYKLQTVGIDKQMRANKALNQEDREMSFSD